MDTISLLWSRDNISHFFPPQLVLQWYADAAPSVQYRDRELPRPAVFLGILMYAFDGFGNLSHAFSDAASSLRPDKLPVTLSNGSVTNARRRLPFPILQCAWEHVRSLVNRDATPSPIKGFRVLCLDGTDFSVADTPENRATYGVPGSRAEAAAFPVMQAALVMDAATHLFIAERHGPYGRASEQSLADAMFEEMVEPGVLLEVDRGLVSYERLRRVRELGGDMLARISAKWKLPVLDVLDDGSFLSAVRGASGRNARSTPRGTHPDDLLVRVIEYHVCDDQGNAHAFRLVTTVLDPGRLPAQAAARGYHVRWGIEVGIREVKWLRERFRIPLFPGKSKDSVEQEYMALLLSHSVLRCAMAVAAQEHGLDPTRLSLSGTLAVLERYLPVLRSATPRDLRDIAARMLRDIARQKLPKPNGRVCPRVVKKWHRQFPAKRRSQPTSTYPDHRLELKELSETAT